MNTMNPSLDMNNDKDIKKIVNSVSHLKIEEAKADNKHDLFEESQETIDFKCIPVKYQEPSLDYIPFRKLQNVCFPFQNQGYCLRGDRCKFDHFPPKLCPCIEWSMGECSRGDACRFAHILPKPEVPPMMKEKFLRSQAYNKAGENSATSSIYQQKLPVRGMQQAQYTHRSVHEKLLEKEYLQRRALEREAAYYRTQYFRSLARKAATPNLARIDSKFKAKAPLNPEAQEFTPKSFE